jgi:hypothetical protein
LISSQTASSSASLSYNLSSYNSYIVMITNVVPSTNAAILYMTFSTSGGSLNSGYTSGINETAYNAYSLVNTNSTSRFLCSDALSNSASIGMSGYINLYQMTSGGIPYIAGQVTMNGSTSGASSLGIISGVQSTGTIVSIQFAMSSGNIASGTISLFGLLE